MLMGGTLRNFCTDVSLRVLVDGVLVCGVWVWAGTLLGCGRTGPHACWVCGCYLFPLPWITVPVLGVVVRVCGGCLFCE